MVTKTQALANLRCCCVFGFGQVIFTDRESMCIHTQFLTTGGHTSESLMLVSALDFRRYTPRTYIVSEGDPLSARKVTALETIKTADHLSQTVSCYLSNRDTEPKFDVAIRFPATSLTIPYLLFPVHVVCTNHCLPLRLAHFFRYSVLFTM